MIYTITSEEGYKKENTIFCDKSNDNTKLIQTILKDVDFPANWVSVEKYFKKKPEIPSHSSPRLRQPRLAKLSTGSDDQTEAELAKSFSQFLSQNKKRISEKEISFIMARNGLSLLSISRDFSAKPSHAQFVQKIQEEVNICGSLLHDFTNILTEFFQSQPQPKCETPKVKKDVVKVRDHSSPPKPGKVSQMLETLRQLEGSITRRDFQKSKSLLAEVSCEVVKFAGKMGLAEAKSQQEDQERRLEQTRRENKVLSERNNNLKEEAASVTASKEKINLKMKILCEAVNNFSQDTKFHSIVATLGNNQDREDNAELKALVEGLKKLQLSYSHGKKKRSEQSNLAVNLVLSDGEAVRFTTNKFNNIGITELERFISKKVTSVSAPQLMDGGYREMKIEKGYVNCPTLGWGDRQYKVVTQAIQGKYQPRGHHPCCNLANISVHLGQGYYSSRAGQRLGGVWGPKSKK